MLIQRSSRYTAVQTQVAIPGGFLDLVLSLESDQGSQVVWVEVKVDAGETGDQLTRYREHADNQPTSPEVIVLGPKRLSDAVPWLSWQDLYQHIPKNDAHAYWRDFRLYLKEIGMANDNNEPITKEEAGSLVGAHALLGKITRVLTSAGVEANNLWPGSNWLPKSSSRGCPRAGAALAPWGGGGRHGGLVAATRR